MRTALRTSIVTAALAGALLAPAATALAAPAPQGVTSVSAVSAVSAASAVASNGDRYDGEIVLVGPGRIAVLRNKSEGPEVWIRAVSKDWKPGDGWAGRVLATLDLSHRRAVVDGTEYELAEAGNGRYGLDVHVVGEGASDGFYLLPKAEPTTTPSTKPSTKPSAQPSTGPSAGPSTQPATAPKPRPTVTATATTSDVKAQTGAQTVVVPKGGVAAGAEIAVEDTDNTTTVAAGAALVAIFAGLGAARIAHSSRARKRS